MLVISYGLQIRVTTIGFKLKISYIEYSHLTQGIAKPNSLNGFGVQEFASL